jgi:hypothetical protein
MTAAERHNAGTVERATRADLRRLGFSVQERGTAALAVSLAMQIDSARGAPAAAAAAHQLRGILADLTAEAADLRPERDELDELRERRSSRDGGSASGS